MNFKLRRYNGKDYEMVKHWWDLQREQAPTREMLPSESTWLLYDDESPILCVTLYLLNSKQFAMIDNFIGNPDFKGEKRREGTKFLLRFLEASAKEMGYKSLFCMGSNDKTKEYYKSIGFEKTLDVTCFIKEIR